MRPLCAPLYSLFDADTKHWRKYIDYNIHPSLSGVCISYPYWTITQPFVTSVIVICATDALGDYLKTWLGTSVCHCIIKCHSLIRHVTLIYVVDHWKEKIKCVPYNIALWYLVGDHQCLHHSSTIVMVFRPMYHLPIFNQWIYHIRSLLHQL